MTTGKWTTSGGMARKARMQEQQLADSNLAEVRQAFSTDLYQLMNVDPKRDKEQVRQIQRGIDDLMLGIQKNGGLGMGVGDMSHFRDIKANKNGEYGQNQQLADLFYEWAKGADNNSTLRQIFASANSKVINSKQEEAARRSKGENLTDVERMIATNADLSAQQLKQYQLLTEAIEKARSYGDVDREREFTEKLRNIGASSTSVSSRGDVQSTTSTPPVSPLLSRGVDEGASLLDWQSRIYDVLCDIRDGGGMGGKASRKKRKEREKAAKKQQDQQQPKD